MQLSFEITLGEFKSALKLHACQKLGRRVHFFIYDYVFPGAAILSLAATAYAYVAAGQDATDSFLFLDATLILLVALLYIVRSYRIRSWFRDMFPAGSKSRTSSMSISDEHIQTSVEGVGDGRYLWSGVSSFVQNETIALFYITDQRFLLLPLRALTSDQRIELNDLIVRHVTARKPC